MRPYIDLSTDVIQKMNAEGLRQSFQPLEVVGSAREALSRMPEGKSGVVLGAGPNTSEWRSKGWVTLDVDPQYGADITGDANYLERFVPDGSLDFVYAECITFDPEAEKGVHPVRLLQQANQALRMGGELIIQTANAYNAPAKSTLPRKEEFAEKMIDLGFRTVVESGEVHVFEHPGGGECVEQRAVYYGEKVADGYSQEQRVETIW